MSRRVESHSAPPRGAGSARRAPPAMAGYALRVMGYEDAMTTPTVFLPEMIAFPLRIGASPALLDAIRQEPLIFAAHYAAVGSLFEWPDDIQDLVGAVRERYAKHDELLFDCVTR